MKSLADYIKYAMDNIYVDDCNCIVCDRELRSKNRYSLCHKCLATMSVNQDRTCIRCGKPIYDESEYCMVCQNSKRYFNRACSPLIYKDSAEKLILNYKFYNKRYLSKYLVSFLVDEYLDKQFNIDLIVPVPITDRVLKERGFSQTKLLADELAQRLNIECSNDIVLKIKDNRHQAKLGGKERQLNVEGVFKLIGKIKDRRVLVVDDILTTGATLSEVARVLLKGKPKSVEGLILANAEYKPYME